MQEGLPNMVTAVKLKSVATQLQQEEAHQKFDIEDKKFGTAPSLVEALSLDQRLSCSTKTAKSARERKREQRRQVQ
jgi:DNA-binding protein H-NS